MHRIKKLTAVILSTLTVSSVCVFGGMNASASGTGAGLAEHCLNAYYEGWSYVWGGTSEGAVDCSGLIWMYCGGDRMSMLSDAQSNGRDWGYVDDGIPRVHGLGLARPGHVGVYIADGMEVDARGSDYGVCYQEIGGWNNWDCWFKLTAVSYPENGWEEFNGDYYYYEDGEYIVNTSRTIDGTTYYFDSKGRSGDTPSDASVDYNDASSDKPSSSSSATSFYRRGSNGSEVEKIQERLKELGFYNGDIDGSFGAVTEQAYRAFQEAAGVAVDGISGTDREVLYSDDAPHANSAESNDDAAVGAEDEQEAAAEETEPEEETKPEETQPEETKPEEETEPEEEAKPAIPAEGDFTTEVIDLQQKLFDLGYFGIEPTGFYGDYTVDAIKSFQLCNSLEVTGVLDEETFALLNSEDAIANPILADSFVEETVAAEEPAPVEEEEVYVEEEDDSVAEPVAAPATVDSALVTVNNTPTQSSAASSNSAAQTNKAANKALQNAASILPGTQQQAQVKRTANIWLWLVLTVIIISAVSLIFLRKASTKKTGKSGKSKADTRAQLNGRW
ncbi:MAG: peptidoglycan-binding protein [Ruminococcus sp.]|nr:peptidoglycan-binding protein [Ruminococcus sp.]